MRSTNLTYNIWIETGRVHPVEIYVEHMVHFADKKVMKEDRKVKQVYTTALWILHICKHCRPPTMTLSMACDLTNAIYGPGMVTFKFRGELPTFNKSLVLSVTLLMTSSTALANGGLFQLTPSPSLTRSATLLFVETTEEPGCSRLKSPKFGF